MQEKGKHDPSHLVTPLMLLDCSLSAYDLSQDVKWSNSYFVSSVFWGVMD